MEDLVSRAKNGDKDAYAELFLDVKDELFNIALKILGNKSDAEDVMQDALLIAYVNIKKLKNNSQFKAWIKKILVNECKKFIKLKNSNTNMLERYAASKNFEDDFKIDEIDFDKIMKLLSDTDQQIFSLFYVDRLTTKQISTRLNINENTIKSRLKIVRDRLRSKYSYMLTIIAVLIMATGVVFGSIALINYIIEQFDLHDVGYNNDNVLDAVADREWVQNVDMDYIELDDNYSIKVDYLLYDDINLYMIFDLQSKSGFGEYNRFSLPSLKVEDENGNVLIDEYNWILSQKLVLSHAWKNIETTDNNIRELACIISNGFPNMNIFTITLNSIALYTQNDDIKTNSNKYSFNSVSFDIELDDKFKNKTSHTYSIVSQSDNLSFEVEKAIFSDTGFYAIIKTKDDYIEFLLEDGNKNLYNYSIRLLRKKANQYTFLITSNIPNENSNKINLLNKKDTSQKVILNYK